MGFKKTVYHKQGLEAKSESDAASALGDNLLSHEDFKSFSIAMETYTTSAGTIKFINRLVLVNEKGDRLLDTLVGAQTLPEGTVVAEPREGTKKRLKNLAQDVGPSLHDIRKVISHLIKGK